MAIPPDARSMERHPDVLEMRDRFERIGASPPAQVVEGLLFLAAGYTAISGWVVGFHTPSSALNVVDLITGIALMVVTIGFATSYGRTYGMAWVAPLLGVWLIVAPWAVHNTDRTTGLVVSNAVAGGCIAFFGLVITSMAFAGRMRIGRRGTGTRRRRPMP